MNSTDSLTDLAQKKCTPCKDGALALNRAEIEVLLKQLNGWRLSDDAKLISKELKCKDFAGALALGNKIGAIAEAEGHHPDLHISWGTVVVELSTHSIGGLSENDFIVAAKIDQIK